MTTGILLAAVLTAGTPARLVDVWNTERGLPQNTVNAVVQTRDGYLWLATFGGLARFDGFTFTVFTAANTPGLRGTRMTALFEDRDGALWIGSETDGVSVYRNGRFESFGAADADPSQPDLRSVRCFTQGSDGTIWIGTTGGVSRWTAADGVAAVPMPPGIANADTLALLEDRDGRIWMGTRDGLVLHEAGASRVFQVGDGLPDAIVISLEQADDGTVWMTTMRGVARISDDRFLPGNPMPIERDRMVYRLYRTAKAIWVSAGERGLFRCASDECVAVDLGLAQPGDVVRSLAEDGQGNIWVGMHIAGLLRLKVPLARAHPVPGFASQSIVPVLGDGDGGLWVGATCGGLMHWTDGAYTTYGVTDGLPHDCIWALEREPDGALWIGTAGEGAARWKDGRFTYYRTSNSGIAGDSIFALHRDRAGVMWIGTSDGLSRFDGSQFTSYGVAQGLPRATIHFITEDRRGTIWLGTTAGAVRFADGRFDTLTTAHGLPHNYVRAIHEDADNVLWFGTFGGGLARYKDGNLAAITTEQGLFDGVVSRILEDESGHFWMTGLRGIFRVSRADLNAVADGTRDAVTSLSFTVADGMPVNETNGGGQPAGWRMDDGRLFFPTMRGLVELDPAAARRPPPPVFIERVVTPRHAAAFAAGATLPAGARDLEFHYTAIDLTSPEKVRFEYRMDGYDDDWVAAGDRRIAYYTNVPAGPHAFRVRAMGGDGVWNESGAAVSFTVAPYFRETPLFYALAGLAVIAVGLVLARWRMAHLTARTRALEQKVSERTTEVVEQKDQLARANTQLEGALRGVEQANQNLLSLLNELHVGAISTDRDGRVVFVSATAASLVPAGEMTGRPWFEALPVTDADRAQLREVASRPPAARIKVPVRMQSRTGRQYWMEVDVRDDPRDPAAKVVFLYDVSEIFDLRQLLDHPSHANGIVGQSAPVQLLLKQIRDVAQVDTTVLIEGETGSGKELVARAIHDGSQRRSKPFIAINCAGLTETLLTSQLFGHRRGAFTGASDDQVGLFEAAQHGTLFLDEVGDMPLSVQTMLLRVLQEREITRLGDSRPRRIDVRVISATHRSLADEVAAGRFRQDLLFRIRVARIVVPPLRQRSQDIPLLASWFLTATSRAAGKPVHDISSDAMGLLMGYEWPGNVRELKSAIESAVIGARGVVIQAADLPRELTDSRTPSPAAQEAAPGVFEGSDRQQIEAAIAQAGGNRAAAARLLGISRATFYRRLQALGIDPGSDRATPPSPTGPA